MFLLFDLNQITKLFDIDQINNRSIHYSFVIWNYPNQCSH